MSTNRAASTVPPSGRGGSSANGSDVVHESADSFLQSDILPALNPLHEQLNDLPDDLDHDASHDEDRAGDDMEITIAQPPRSSATRSIRPQVTAELPPRPPTRNHRSSSRPYALEAPHQSDRSASPQGSGRPTTRDPGYRSRSALHRLIENSSSNIPHFASRVAAQLTYIENSRVSRLRDHTAALKRIFHELLQLQLKLPDTGRFHLLFESQNGSVTTSAARVTSVDLFSIFSPTVSTETHERRDNICTMGEVLVDFKKICDAERPLPPPTTTSAPLEPSTTRSAAHGVSPTTVQSDAASAGQLNATTGVTAQPSPSTSQDRPQQANGEDDGEIDIDGDDSSLQQKWFTVPQTVLDRMLLPDWFPSPSRNVSSSFTQSTLTVDIDDFLTLNLKDALFVYRGLLRSAHKKSLLPSEKVKYDGNRHFKRCFSYIPFTPPWFVAHMDCRVRGKSLFPDPLTFDCPNMPRVKDVRSAQVLQKLQGIIAAFHSRDHAFAGATIDYLVAKCTTVTNHSSAELEVTTPEQRSASASTPPPDGQEILQSSADNGTVRYSQDINAQQAQQAQQAQHEVQPGARTWTQPRSNPHSVPVSRSWPSTFSQEQEEVGRDQQSTPLPQSHLHQPQRQRQKKVPEKTALQSQALSNSNKTKTTRKQQPTKSALPIGTHQHASLPNSAVAAKTHSRDNDYADVPLARIVGRTDEQQRPRPEDPDNGKEPALRSLTTKPSHHMPVESTDERNQQQDEPLSPHSMTMKAFNDRSRNRTAKRKRALSLGYYAIAANQDSDDESVSSDDSDFMSPGPPPAPKRPSKRPKRTARKSTKKPKQKSDVPPAKRGATTYAASSSRRKKNNTDHVSSNPDPTSDNDNDCIYVGPVVDDPSPQSHQKQASAGPSDSHPAQKHNPDIVAKQSDRIPIATSQEQSTQQLLPTAEISLSSSLSRRETQDNGSQCPPRSGDTQAASTSVCSVTGCPGRASTYHHTCSICNAFVHPLCEMLILKYSPEDSDSHLCSACYARKNNSTTCPPSQVPVSAKTQETVTPTIALQSTTTPPPESSLPTTSNTTKVPYSSQEIDVPSQATLLARQLNIEDIFNELRSNGNN